jgi:hypothetical protein
LSSVSDAAKSVINRDGSAFRIVDVTKIQPADIIIEEDSCAVLQLYSCVNV